jgi:uncharacterized protein YdaU (DUF1376 family)
LTANVFEELDTMRDTNWQYELQQLRIVNKRLKEEIEAITSGADRGQMSGSASGSSP